MCQIDLSRAVRCQGGGDRPTYAFVKLEANTLLEGLATWTTVVNTEVKAEMTGILGVWLRHGAQNAPLNVDYTTHVLVLLRIYSGYYARRRRLYGLFWSEIGSLVSFVLQKKIIAIVFRRSPGSTSSLLCDAVRAID